MTKTPTEKSYHVIRDPAGVTHALAGAAPVNRMESVLITVCALRLAAQDAKPMDSTNTKITCATCMENLAKER